MEVGNKEKNKLKDKVNSLPDACGVYIFKDTQGNILYIGKAKLLKKRVQSYFSRELSSKTQILVSKIADIEYRVTPSEAQAQLLEAALVKEKKPQYNISLKDDKSFPWIRISDEKFPIVSICRRKSIHKEDTALYFGPYTNAKLLRQAFKAMRRIFGFRSCRVLPKQACLYFRLKLCPAPCAGNIAAKEYGEIIGNIKMFLASEYEELVDNLSDRMKKLAFAQSFEEAAKIRDQLNALSVFAQTAPVRFSAYELEDLKSLLKLKKLPRRIEAFDISNIKGQQATGSLASFLDGLPDKNNYRRFRIKTFTGIDDYRMLREIVLRRYSRLLKENSALPDLVLIDGGKGHLKIAEDEISKLGIKIPLVSIAKDREYIYIKDKPKPIKLHQDTPALNLIRRMRDEAHRFALKYHRVLRRKKIIGK